MIRPPPRSTRTDTLFPYTTLFRSSGYWFTWLILAGRGWGKTRTGSEWVRDLAHQYPGCRIALVAETAADARDVMIKGDSGLLNIDPTLSEDAWSPTNRCLTWPNGTRAWTYNATEPTQRSEETTSETQSQKSI